MVNVGKYTIHGCYGIAGKLPCSNPEIHRGCFRVPAIPASFCSLIPESRYFFDPGAWFRRGWSCTFFKRYNLRSTRYAVCGGRWDQQKRISNSWGMTFFNSKKIWFKLRSKLLLPSRSWNGSKMVDDSTIVKHLFSTHGPKWLRKSRELRYSDSRLRKTTWAARLSWCIS